VPESPQSPRAEIRDDSGRPDVSRVTRCVAPHQGKFEGGCGPRHPRAGPGGAAARPLGNQPQKSCTCSDASSDVWSFAGALLGSTQGLRHPPKVVSHDSCTSSFTTRDLHPTRNRAVRTPPDFARPTCGLTPPHPTRAQISRVRPRVLKLRVLSSPRLSTLSEIMNQTGSVAISPGVGTQPSLLQGINPGPLAACTS